MALVMETRTVRKGMMAYCRLLDVTWTHLTKVLSGERESKRLMAKIKKECPELLRLYGTKKGTEQ